MFKGFELAAELKRLGLQMTAELSALLAEQYADGVPEPELGGLKAKLTVRAGMRVVNGGGV